MARPTILNLTRVGGAFNAEPYIESRADAVSEQKCRIKLIGKALDMRQNLFRRSQALRLKHKLLSQSEYEPNTFSQASSLHLRQWRLAGVEQLSRLVAETGVENCSSWTAIRPAWISSTSEDFSDQPAAHLTEQFRSLLNRHGASDADGWLLAKLDCEFDTHNRLSRHHLHGVACGGMIEVLDRMRESAAFRSQRSPAIKGRRIARPLQIQRRIMTNLPMPLSYILKGHYSARWLGVTSKGQVKRGNRPIRIPEPYGTQALLWLDRQPFPDMFVMHGLTIRKGQLIRRT